MPTPPVTFGPFFSNFFTYLGGSSAYSSVGRFAAHLWLAIIVIGYLLSFTGLAVIAWALMRLFDLRKREEQFYGTVITAPEREQQASPRWQHIENLVSGGSPSEWREAIIEADIMLDDLLARQGYIGEGVGEKLRQVARSDMGTLNDAWEVHRIRNQIAHEGSTFDLSQTLAQRTIARYETIFREFRVI